MKMAPEPAPRGGALYSRFQCGVEVSSIAIEAVERMKGVALGQKLIAVAVIVLAELSDILGD